MSNIEECCYSAGAAAAIILMHSASAGSTKTLMLARRLVPSQQQDKDCHIVQGTLPQGCHDQRTGNLLCNRIAHMALACHLVSERLLNSTGYVPLLR